jgi:hypothetical protein
VLADEESRANGTAESRYTLGRNCTRFKGYAGLADRSADGSAGTVTLSAVTPRNTVEPVWVPPALHPGVLVSVDLRLAAPGRFAIAGQNTSTPIDDRGRSRRPISPSATRSCSATSRSS